MQSPLHTRVLDLTRGFRKVARQPIKESQSRKMKRVSGLIYRQLHVCYATA